MRRPLAAAVLLMAGSLSAGVVQVDLKLPLKPKLSVESGGKVVIAPFIIVSTQADVKKDRAGKVDVQSEFARYLRKQLTKSTSLKLMDLPATRLPSSNFKELAANKDYWKELGRKSGADYVISGVLDFDIQDKAGYRTEEYVSPLDGRTYYRQVLVESTGFVFDIVIAVFDADTGEKKIEENFRDFKEFDQRNYDEIRGLFENLQSLESQILGIFVPQETSAQRYLFTN